MDVDGVGEVTPGLDLLGDLLCVWRGEHAGDASVFEGVRQRIQKLRDRIRQTNRCEDARAEEGVAAESIKERIFGTGDIRVNPLYISDNCSMVNSLTGPFSHLRIHFRGR
jgi:hypothetical protein